MASARAKKKEYESKAIINKISATSRASIQIDGKFYTLEYSEERIIPDISDIDITKERELLWNTVNAEVDEQIADVYDTYGELKKKSKK